MANKIHSLPWFIDSILIPGEETWYHGTTSDNAKNIVDNGISSREVNTRRQDFSDGGGFYLQDNLESAIFWAKSKSRTRGIKYSSVLIYRVSKNELERHKTQQDFDSSRHEWTQVIRYYR